MLSSAGHTLECGPEAASIQGMFFVCVCDAQTKNTPWEKYRFLDFQRCVGQSERFGHSLVGHLALVDIDTQRQRFVGGDGALEAFVGQFEDVGQCGVGEAVGAGARQPGWISVRRPRS